jgi:hypothetical protein
MSLYVPSMFVSTNATHNNTYNIKCDELQVVCYNYKMWLQAQFFFSCNDFSHQTQLEKGKEPPFFMSKLN